jgi:hypothetical protein
MPPDQEMPPIFMPACLKARNSSRSPVFENIILPPSGLRLTSNLHAALFDNSTKRGNTLDIR